MQIQSSCHKFVKWKNFVLLSAIWHVECIFIYLQKNVTLIDNKPLEIYQVWEHVRAIQQSHHMNVTLISGNSCSF